MIIIFDSYCHECRTKNLIPSQPGSPGLTDVKKRHPANGVESLTGFKLMTYVILRAGTCLYLSLGGFLALWSNFYFRTRVNKIEARN